MILKFQQNYNYFVKLTINSKHEIFINFVKKETKEKTRNQKKFQKKVEKEEKEET
jgi:hypothetical protein